MTDVIIVFLLCSISLIVGYIRGFEVGKREMFEALNETEAYRKEGDTIGRTQLPPAGSQP